MYDDKDGFTHVSKKHKKRNQINRNSKLNNQQIDQNKLINNQHNEPTSDTDTDDQHDELTDEQLDKIIKFYERKSIKFSSTNYFKSFTKLLKDVLKNDTKFDQVICYGLGNFNKITISRKQLYFLISLRKLVKCLDWQIYDPIFKSDELIILKKLNFNLIEDNEYCRRSIDNKRTLFYMPHCCKFMFNNLLWSNWNLESFKNLYLIGNSFNLICDNFLDSKNERKVYSYVHNLKKLDQFVNEYPIENNYSNIRLFNDLSLHTFNTNNFNQNDLLKFYNSQIPIYDDDNDKKFKKVSNVK